MLLALLLAAADPTGWTPQGLPLLSYNTDEGLGYGVRILMVDHGQGDEKPFRYSVMGQFYQTTKGVAAHRLFFDAPHFLGSRLRIDLDVAWSIDKFSPWYGVGNDAQYVKGYDTCDDRSQLNSKFDECTGNTVFRGLRWYRYDRNTLPRIKLNVRSDISGPWKALGGWRLTVNRITPLYSSTDLGQPDDSQLASDARAGKLVGWDGQNPSQRFTLRTAELTAGLVYDTRDNEPAPTEGMFHEFSARLGAKPFGSQFNYRGANLTARFYHWVFVKQFVAAARILADATGGDVPFFQLSTTGGLDGPDGLGGQFSARGVLKNRLQGKVKVVVTPELRWRFFEGSLIDVEAVAGVDAGRVWAEWASSEGGGLAAGASGGVRVAWNKNFVVRVDYGLGISESVSALYITFDEMF